MVDVAWALTILKELMAELAFGTDGYRGEANNSTLTGINPTTFEKLSYDFAGLMADVNNEANPIVIVGRDTRDSGKALSEAVAIGSVGAGAEVWDIGIAPTPVIAWLAKAHGCSAVAITASHNPNSDNGFKPFISGGIKPGQEFIDELTRRYDAGEQPHPGYLGKVYNRSTLINLYLAHVVPELGGYGTLAGKTLVVDGANGAAYDLAPRLYRRLGAEVVEFACSSTGKLINENCGAAHLEGAKAFLKSRPGLTDSDNFLGLLSHDGDGDRVMALDANGQTIDGNYWLQHLAEDQEGIVGTEYTNTALRRVVQASGVQFHECPNGDSQVTAKLQELGLKRGGEFTGHLIDLEHLSSGDGLYMGAWLAVKAAQTGMSFMDIKNELELFPERMVNVSLRDGKPVVDVLSSSYVQEGIARARQLAEEDDGRLIVRVSGTEPIIRVWSEAKSLKIVRTATNIVKSYIDQWPYTSLPRA
ncbi:MAG TPA: hypothetical protein VGF75_01390 [Candidatus Saccharimonadales bacterium]|jgi:phosphoglucosamine mutase